MTHVARLGLAAVLASSACTLVFNTDELPNRDADPIAIDADIDAPVDAPIDADPSMLSLATIDPAITDEAVGSSGRPLLVLITATNLVDESTIDLAWDPDEPTPLPPATLVGMPVISGATGHIALALAIPEIPGAAFGEGDPPRMLRIGVTPQTGTRQTITMMVRLHDELALAGTIDAATPAFEERTYSSITTTGAVTVTGARPLRLAAYGAIAINHAITVPPPNAGGCPGGNGGPAGGSSGGTAACGAGSGAGGAGSTVGPGTAGGGGGFGSMGGGGGGGMVAGNPMLVPFLGGPNHSAGGGGGGGSLLNPGGAGGPGGGSVHVRAGGAVQVGAGGRIFANGGPGAAGVGSGGDGGGGSGGAILIQSGAPIEYAGGAPFAWLSAIGGTGASNNGGGVGRIRIDDPAGGGAIAGNPAHHGGPTFDVAALPLIVRDPALMVTARGDSQCALITPPPNPPLDTCNAMSDRQLLPAGTTLRFALTPGRNTLCAHWTGGAMIGGTAGLPEARTCVDVLYVE